MGIDKPGPAATGWGSSWQKTERRQEAETLLRQATVLQKGFAEAHRDPGILLRDMGQAESAKAELKKASVLFMRQARRREEEEVNAILKELG